MAYPTPQDAFEQSFQEGLLPPILIGRACLLQALKVFCILLLYWLFCILVLELSHRAKGRHYTIKLKAYQSESSHKASDAPQLVTAYDVTDNKNGADK